MVITDSHLNYNKVVNTTAQVIQGSVGGQDAIKDAVTVKTIRLAQKFLEVIYVLNQRR